MLKAWFRCLADPPLGLMALLVRWHATVLPRQYAT